MDFSLEQIAQLRKIANALSVFREIDPKMTLTTMATALEVAMRGEQGANIKYIESTLGLPTPSAARQLQILEPKRETAEKRIKGHGLIEAKLDPNDPRGKIRVPTKKMEVCVNQVLLAMNSSKRT